MQHMYINYLERKGVEVLWLFLETKVVVENVIKHGLAIKDMYWVLMLSLNCLCYIEHS